MRRSYPRYPTTAAALVLSLALSLAITRDALAVEPKAAPSGVVYVAGGIGDAQQAALQKVTGGYTLRLTFARPQSGTYLADVRVRIDDAAAAGTGSMLLDATATGPMLFARLPDGRYQVHAKHGGRV